MIGSKSAYRNAFLMIILGSIFVRYLKIFFGDMVYLLIIAPLFVLIFCSIWQKKYSRSINKIDGIIWLLFVFIFINLAFSFFRGTISSQLIFVLYIVLPFGVYLFVRKMHLTSNQFIRIFSAFSLVCSLVIIIEFSMYYVSPELRGIGTAYLRDVVGNNNFYPPHVNYPLIGWATKPWGPLLDASASGAFASVLFCSIFEYSKTCQSRKYRYISYVLLFSLFLSGSKSAYVMTLIYFMMRSLIFVGKDRYGFVIIRNISLFLFSIGMLWGMVIMFFSGDIGVYYFQQFVVVPIVNLLDGFLYHGVFVVFGLGQETNINIIVGTGEVDFINSIFRYGVLFMFFMISLLFYMIIKSYNVNNYLFVFFFMIILSMNHYQVAFKFPVSLILFSAIAVWNNSREEKFQ